MEGHHGHGNGQVNLMITIFSSILTWITIKEAQVVLGLFASGVAIISGIFAARYYYFAAKEKQKNLNNK